MIVPFYEGLPIRLLQDEIVKLEFAGLAIRLIGLSCSHNPGKDAGILEELACNDKDAFDILLYHSPDLAPRAAEAGIDIQFSGHTHGG